MRGGDPASQMSLPKIYSRALVGKSTCPFVGEAKLMLYAR